MDLADRLEGRIDISDPEGNKWVYFRDKQGNWFRQYLFKGDVRSEELWAPEEDELTPFPCTAMNSEVGLINLLFAYMKRLKEAELAIDTNLEVVGPEDGHSACLAYRHIHPKEEEHG